MAVRNAGMNWETNTEKLFKGTYSTMYRGHRIDVELVPLADFSYNAIYSCHLQEPPVDEKRAANDSHKDSQKHETDFSKSKDLNGSRQIRTVAEYHAIGEQLRQSIDRLLDGEKKAAKKAPFSFQYRIRTR